MYLNIQQHKYTAAQIKIFPTMPQDTECAAAVTPTHLQQHTSTVTLPACCSHINPLSTAHQYPNFPCLLLSHQHTLSNTPVP